MDYWDGLLNPGRQYKAIEDLLGSKLMIFSTSITGKFPTKTE